MNTPFPYVAENMEKEVEKWKKLYKEMGHKNLTTNVSKT